jgi:hypothetical protein
MVRPDGRWLSIGLSSGSGVRAASLVSQAGVTGVACIDEHGLCLKCADRPLVAVRNRGAVFTPSSRALLSVAAKGNIPFGSTGCLHSLAQRARALADAAGDQPVVTIETDSR